MKDYMSVKLTPEMQEELNDLLVHHSDFNYYKETIIRAFKFAVCAHEGVKRKTGEDYVFHPIRVAKLMDDCKADYQTICAALLHDTVEDVDWVDYKLIEEEFGTKIAKLVKYVTKASIKGATKEEEVTATINDIFRSLPDDPRAILIKFADRIDNMGSIEGHKDPQKRIKIAEQTLNIFVPIAGLLSVYKMKEKLEEMAFKVIQEEKGLIDLKYIKSEKKRLFDDNDEVLAFIGKITQTDIIPRIIKEYDPKFKLISSNVRKHVEFSFKPYAQIYEKMKRLNLVSMQQIHDLFKIRINTNSVEDCYRAIEAIESYKKDGEELEYFGKHFYYKDYINKPAFNGYQAIHTRYYVKSINQVVQFEFRTFQMRTKAINGIASCWNYDHTDPVQDMKEFLYKMPFYSDLAELCRKYEGDIKNKSKDKLLIEKEFFNGIKTKIAEKRVKFMLDNSILDLVPNLEDSQINLPRKEEHQEYNGCTLEEFLHKHHPEYLNDGSIFQINGANIPYNYQLKDEDIIKRVSFDRYSGFQRTHKKEEN